MGYPSPVEEERDRKGCAGCLFVILLVLLIDGLCAYWSIIFVKWLMSL